MWVEEGERMTKVWKEEGGGGGSKRTKETTRQKPTAPSQGRGKQKILKKQGRKKKKVALWAQVNKKGCSSGTLRQ